jgi:hypothetical protein
MIVIDPDNPQVIPIGSVKFHSSDIYDGSSYGAQNGVSFGAAFSSTTCTLIGSPASGSTPASGSCTVYYTEDNCPAYISGSCWGRNAKQNHDVTITAASEISQPSAFGDLASAKVEFQTCFMHACLVNDQAGDSYKLYVCALGDSKFDLVNFCLLMEQDYTNQPSNVWMNALSNTQDPPYIGVQFPGAGLLAAAAGALISTVSGAPGGGECAPFVTTPLDGAISFAQSQGEDVPGAGACPFPGTKTLLSDYILGYVFIGGNLADNEVRCANGVQTACQQVGIDTYLDGVLGGILAAPPLVIPAATLFASAAVMLSVGCGYTDDHCYGTDLTANLLANPLGKDGIGLQSKQIPIPILGGQIAPVWGYFIGWSTVSCTLTSGNCPNVVPNGIYYNGGPTPSDFKDKCTSSYPAIPSGCPNPGSAGSVPQGTDPLAFGYGSGANPSGAIKCVTGRADGRSIGYDGDVSFDLGQDNSIPALQDDTPITSLTNVYNFLPGEGGSLPPNGIDVEVSLGLRPAYFTQLSELSKGTVVHVCGHWVSDMHDFWNELHPITSMAILSEFSVSASPSDLTVLAGKTASYGVTLALLSGVGAPVTLSVTSVLPPGITATFTNNPVTPAGTSTMQVSTSTGCEPGCLGDFALTIQGQDGSGQIHTMTVKLRVYDYAISVAPLSSHSDTALRNGGQASYSITDNLATGSTTTDLPNTLSIQLNNIPLDASPLFTTPMNFPHSTGLPMTESITITSGPSSIGDFGLSATGTVSGPSGGSRTSTTFSLHVYDFSVVASPTSLQVLTTGSNTYRVSVGLVSGSSIVGLPSVGLALTGLPAGATQSFSTSSGSASGFTSILTITTTNAPSGTYTLVIAGTDSRPQGGMRTTSPTLRVLTPQQALQLVSNQVMTFQSNHVLNSGQANSLITKLQMATNSLNLEPAHKPTACNQLNSFVNEVNSLVGGGVLTPAQAGLLLGGPLGVLAIMVSIPC